MDVAEIEKQARQREREKISLIVQGKLNEVQVYQTSDEYFVGQEQILIELLEILGRG